MHLLSLLLWLQCLSDPLTYKRQDEPLWLDLFNGHNFDGWVLESRDRADLLPNWTITPDGYMRCEAKRDAFGFLRYEKRTFANFRLLVEYRFEPQEVSKFKGNSGIGIRTCRFDPKNHTATRPSFAAYEIQLLDDAKQPATAYSTASLYRYASPKTNRVKPSPQWNQIEVTCDGPRIQIQMNGELVLDVDQTHLPDLSPKDKPRIADIKAPPEKPLSGYISLQSHTGTIEFRKVRLQEKP